MFAARPDERDAGRCEPFGEIGVFAQKSVTGMNGGRARLAACGQDRIAAHIALRGGIATDADGTIGAQNGPREAIRIGVHRDRTDAHPA